MIKEAVCSFKSWVVSSAISDIKADIKANVAFLNSKIMTLEAAEKSRGEALDLMISSAEPIKPVCDDCISMRLEMDSLKARLEALEIAQKNGSGGNGGQASNMYAVPASDKPKLRRRKGDAKELVA